MAAIKKFFQQRKIDTKFKLAGEGHKLTDDTRVKASAPNPTPVVPASKREVSAEKQMAAEAALARMNKAQAPSKPNSSIRSEARKEILAEQEAKKKALAEAAKYAPPTPVEIEAHPAAATVLFHCSLIGPDRLPKGEMEARIEEFLLSQLGEEPAMTSALMIHTLNKSSEQVKQCIEMLGKYLDNIIEHPGEEKYRRIRSGNKVLVEKVLSLRGANEFLQAVGFEKLKIEGTDGTNDEFLVLSSDKASDAEHLKSLKEFLSIAEPIRPELDRDVKVFYPSSKASKIEVPNDFYAISVDEIKKEMQLRQEAVEKCGMLRTKEMREKDRIRELRRYRYCLIRVRFPNEILLQGTFRANEKLAAVLTFVTECLEHDWIPFTLSNQLGLKMTDENSTLAELNLAPASLLQFAYDPSVLAEVSAQKESFAITAYLKKEILNLISSL